MPDTFEQLANKLDSLPQGFPSTESGVELKILKKIFTPEDAEMALKLKPIPETAEVIAKRLEISVEKMRAILDNMAEKGQIGCRKMVGEQVYMFAAFIPGIYEFQVYRLDKELTLLIEEYFPHVMKIAGGYEPGLARTVPVNKHIEPGIHLENYEDIRILIENARSFNVKDCICQKERKILGHECKHSMECCLNISTEDNAFDYFSIGGRIITKEEALKVLDNSEKEGLIHNAFLDTKEGHVAICNCCPCCCSAIRGIKEFGAALTVAKSNFVAFIDQETCNECNVCLEERCPMEAIVKNENIFKVLPDVCIGCGVCTVTCPTESITLVRRPLADQTQPAANVMDWFAKRAASREMELKFD